MNGGRWRILKKKDFQTVSIKTKMRVAVCVNNTVYRCDFGHDIKKYRVWCNLHRHYFLIGYPRGLYIVIQNWFVGNVETSKFSKSFTHLKGKTNLTHLSIPLILLSISCTICNECSLTIQLTWVVVPWDGSPTVLKRVCL